MTPDEIRYLLNLILGALATVALAPIFVALRPERHAAAAAQVDTAPGLCLAWGLGPLLCLIVAVWWLAVVLLPVGSGAVLVLTGLVCGLGAGVSGRALGARLTEEGSPLRQTLIGTALLCGSAVWPVAGLLIYVVAVAIGLGGWLRIAAKKR